jgi:hypothetical protein
MANNTVKAWTYDDKAIREDLLDVITNIDPTERGLIEYAGTSTANAVLHEWPIDILDTVGTNFQIEGANAPTVNMTNPTRVQNLTQIFAKAWTITGTELAVNTAGYSDRKTYELTKKMKALKNDMEFAFMRGSSATGNGTAAARQLTGVKNFISTNATTQSGTTFSEAILTNLLSNTWTSGGKVDTLFVGPTLKTRISGFSANTTRYVGSDEKHLTNTINLYSSDYGAETINARLHRYVTVSGDVNNDIVGLQADTWAVAWLRKPKNTPLATTGDAENGELIGEATIESLAEKANFLGRAYT